MILKKEFINTKLLFVLTWSAWLSFIILNPFFQSNLETSWNAIVFIGAATVAFVLGYLAHPFSQKHKTKDSFQNTFKIIPKNFNLILMLIAALGCAFRLYQLLVLRDFSALGDVTLQRYSAMTKQIQGGIMSAIILALAGAYIPAAIIYVSSNTKNKFELFLFILTTLLYVFICYLSGGRNGIVFVFLILILTFLRFSPHKITAKMYIYGLGAGFLIFSYILYTFNVREQIIRDRGPNKGVAHFTLYHDVVFNHQLLKAFESPEVSRGVMSLATTAAYITHSLPELALVVANEDKIPHSFSGYNTTFPFNLFIEKATGINLEKTSFNFREGRYKTLYASFIFDFGIGCSLILIFFWGAMSHSLDFSCRHCLTYAPAYILNLLLILFSPIYNLISTSNMFPSFAWAIILPGVLYVYKKK